MLEKYVISQRFSFLFPLLSRRRSLQQLCCNYTHVFGGCALDRCTILVPRIIIPRRQLKLYSDRAFKNKNVNARFLSVNDRLIDRRYRRGGEREVRCARETNTRWGQELRPMLPAGAKNTLRRDAAKGKERKRERKREGLARASIVRECAIDRRSSLLPAFQRITP